MYHLEIKAIDVKFLCFPVSVEAAAGQSCQSSSFVLPSASSGYLSNYVTIETGKGSADCPWMIQARQGQRINITLIDFARHSPTESNNVEQYDICHVYAGSCYSIIGLYAMLLKIWVSVGGASLIPELDWSIPYKTWLQNTYIFSIMVESPV